jgi:hypothetical protein
MTSLVASQYLNLDLRLCIQLVREAIEPGLIGNFPLSYNLQLHKRVNWNNSGL